jgi:hypothetical protein
MKKLIWTEGYDPFIMGGDCRAPIGLKVEVGEKVPIGKGFFAYVIRNPTRKRKQHIVCAVSGAIVGSSLRGVRKDVKEGDIDVMRKQVRDAKKRRTKVRIVPPDRFWPRFR